MKTMSQEIFLGKSKFSCLPAGDNFDAPRVGRSL